MHVWRKVGHFNNKPIHDSFINLFTEELQAPSTNMVLNVIEHSGLMNWDIAKNLCQNVNKMLVMPKTEQEAEIVRSFSR